ncbi:hypothetical protein MBLNU230_g4593t1 [Neophaeotheca triangularis]
MRPSPILGRKIARLALNTKQAGKDYYKGTGTGSMGRHTKHGGYIIEWHKVRTYVCPDTSASSLKPFVAKRIEPRNEDFKGLEGGALDGKEYLRRWKEHVEMYGEQK